MTRNLLLIRKSENSQFAAPDFYFKLKVALNKIEQSYGGLKMKFDFYESYYDALQKSIALSGKTMKAIAAAVYPGRQIETAKSLLSRALSPENNDVHINLENLDVIINETRVEDFLFCLCDKHGFERPVRKTTETIKKDIHSEVSEINAKLKNLLRQLPALDEKNNDHRK